MSVQTPQTTLEALDLGLWRIDSGRPGIPVLLTVGLHPDEAGDVVQPILHLLRLLLCRGSVTFMHVFPGSPPDRHVGVEKRDPNRSFIPEVLDVGDDPFRRRLRQLSALIDEAEIAIDLHRYSKSDGGIIAFPYDERGIALAADAELPLIVTGMVPRVQGAYALHVAKRDKIPLVLEVGPKGRPETSDRNTLSALVGALRALGNFSEHDRIDPASSWSDASGLFSLDRAIRQDELTAEGFSALRQLAHMAPIPKVLQEELNLPDTARLLLINPQDDPAAYVCLPTPNP